MNSLMIDAISMPTVATVQSSRSITLKVEREERVRGVETREFALPDAILAA